MGRRALPGAGPGTEDMLRSVPLTEAICANFALPDAIMDGVCEIAAHVARADYAILVVFSGRDAVVFGSWGDGRAKPARFARKALERRMGGAAPGVVGSVLPPGLTENRAAFRLKYDNGIIGQLIVGYADAATCPSPAERQVLQRLVQVAASNILQETTMSLAAQRFFMTIERDKV